jgi:hypothetical protein
VYFIYIYIGNFFEVEDQAIRALLLIVLYPKMDFMYCDCNFIFIFCPSRIFNPISQSSLIICKMADMSHTQGNSDLAYVTEIIQSLSAEKKAEFFKQFATYTKKSSEQVAVRPTTPVKARPFLSESSTSKRPLNSPGSPYGRKKDTKVYDI